MTPFSSVQHNRRMVAQRGRLESVNHNTALAHTIHVIYAMFMGLSLLLLVRVLLHAFGVGPDNGPTNSIYQISQPFADVFALLFHNPQVGTHGVLEITTLVGVAIYISLGWMIGRILWLMLSRPR